MIKIVGRATSTFVLLGTLPNVNFLSYFVRVKDFPRIFGYPGYNSSVKSVEFCVETTVITASICMPWGTNSNAAFWTKLEILQKVLEPRESNGEVNLTKFVSELGKIESTVRYGWRAVFDPKIWQTGAVISAIEWLPNVVNLIFPKLIWRLGSNGASNW